MITALYVTRILPHYRRDVFVALQSSPGLRIEYAAARGDDSGIETISFEDLRGVHELRNLGILRFTFQTGVWRAIRRSRADMVVFEGNALILSTWVYAAILRLAGKKVAFWTIGWHRPDRGLARHVRLAFYRLAHGLLVYGRRGIQLGVQAGYPKERMHFIGNSSSVGRAPIETVPDYFKWKATVQGLPRGPWIVSVIRLNRVKRLDLLLRATARLKESGHPIPVVLVGDGPERGRLEELARKLGVEVHFLGAVYSEAQLDEIYLRAAVTVIPRAAGLTVLQSLRFGVPVVTDTDWDAQMPEAEAIVPGRTGSYYPTGDVGGLAREVLTWVQVWRQDAAALRQECRDHLEQQWSVQRHTERITLALFAISSRESQQVAPNGE